MTLCSDGHDEVCYESSNCPVCENIADLQKQIDKLETQVEGLIEEVRELNIHIQES